MPEWKKNIFVSAIKVRMEREERCAADIIGDYTRLTEDEKQEIIEALEVEQDGI